MEMAGQVLLCLNPSRARYWPAVYTKEGVKFYDKPAPFSFPYQYPESVCTKVWQVEVRRASHGIMCFRCRWRWRGSTGVVCVVGVVAGVAGIVDVGLK